MQYYVSDFPSSFINWFYHFHNTHNIDYISSLICNVNIQNAHAAAFIFNWWMDILEKQSNFSWQKIYSSNGVGVWEAPERPTSWQMLYHLNFELSSQDAFYLMFLILALVEKIYRVFIYGVILKKLNS